MRADRLLSILMLLQTRGRMSAQALAKELEVSERTIYRDIDALSAAGVPVYGEAGREGGYALLDSYRTNLTGLTEGEVRALFMLQIPSPLAELGVSRELKAAFLKLSAALPRDRHRDEEWVRQRFYLDSSPWHQGEEAVPHLQTVHQAVWHDRKLQITYRPLPMAQIELLVAPYAMVAKAGVWHLVCAANDRLRVYHVSEFLDARILDETFTRLADFDLAAFWENWCAAREKSYSDFRVVVRVAPNFIPALPFYLGDSLREKVAQAGPPDAEGWIKLELAFESLEAARDRLLDFGRGVQVLEPWALRRSIRDFAEQILSLYAEER